MINRKKPVLKPNNSYWKPKSKVWFGKNDDSEMGEEFIVTERGNEEVVAGPYKKVQRARNKVDKLDNEYGGYKYTYRRRKR